MKFSSKFINFFSSKYYSNIKYNHSFASLLRIFFERAAKFQNTVSNLGNVYRNSKWSDLKVQNIKQLHLTSFVTILLSSIALLIFLFQIIFVFDATSYSSLTSVLFWPIVYSLDILSYAWLCIALALYTASNKAQLTFSTYFYDVVISRSSLAPTKNINLRAISASIDIPSSITSNNIDKNWIELAHSLYRAKLSLNITTPTAVNSNTLVSVDPSLPSNLSIFLRTNGSSYIATSQVTPLSSNRIKYYANASSASLNSVGFNNNLTLSALASSNSLLAHSYENAIKENLSVANQTRWALKMSPVSHKLINDNFNFTQAKSLIGSSVVNSLSSSNNIWNSSNLQNVSNLEGLLLPSNLTNLNSFEDSRLWVSKKYSFSSSTADYSLFYTASNPVDITSENNYKSVLSAYLLDYELMSSNLSLFSTIQQKQSSLDSLLYTPDSTVYQDSYNNYLLALSSTTLTTRYNNYSYSKANTNTFKFSA